MRQGSSAKDTEESRDFKNEEHDDQKRDDLGSMRVEKHLEE